MSLQKIHIILVDDHEIVMDGIESLLNAANDLQVVGKASSAAAAETLIQQLRPDLVLTDISMGEVSGLELTKRILQRFPSVKVMVLSMHDGVQYISSLLEAGASGYLLKNVKQEELFKAIHSVMAGETFIQSSLLESYTDARKHLEATPKRSALTPRELEIIRLIAQERTTAEISQQLYLSEKTVETHRKNIGRKTGAKTAISLLKYAREHGIL